jgi:hypothetical protein
MDMPSLIKIFSQDHIQFGCEARWFAVQVYVGQSKGKNVQ